MHCVSWQTVGKLVNLWGLELGNLRAHNQALLDKGSGGSLTLWYRIIVSQHGPHSFECVLGVDKGTYKNPWKYISSELPSFSFLVKSFVGDGRDTYFWEYEWVGIACFALRLFVYIIYPP